MAKARAADQERTLRTLKRTPQRDAQFNIAFQTGGSSTRMPLSTKPGRSLSDFAAHKAPSI